jgi:hypothetical protein
VDNPPFEPPDSWDRYQVAVLGELRRAQEERRTIAKELQSATIEIAKLKASASFWGAGAGAMVSGIVSLIAGLILWALTRT